MNRIGLCLEPLDVLFFRDGRPFAAASRVTSGLPTPQVLAGAVRTALLEKYQCDFAALGRSTRGGLSFADGLPEPIRWIAGVRFRGPWLCRIPAPDANVVPDVFFPVPTIVHTGKKGAQGVYVLKPRKHKDLPGWTQTLRPLWLDGTVETEGATGFIDSAGLVALLNGKIPVEDNLHRTNHPKKRDDFYTFDHRTGIGIHPDQFVAGDGEIYGISFLSLKCGYGFYADVQLPEGAPDDALAGIPFLAFGGEGKRVAVRTIDPFVFPAPACGPGQNRFVLLTTPGVTNSKGEPYSFGSHVVAAAVNAPVAISGWDIAKNGPKPTRFAAPAGSVYFLNSADPVPEHTDEFGYGCHLQGVWTDA